MVKIYYKCCVEACFNTPRKSENISFHLFPKNKLLRCKWIYNIIHLNKQTNGFEKGSRICNAHFRKDCLQKAYSFNKGSTPTIFPNLDSSETSELDMFYEVQELEKIEDNKEEFVEDYSFSLDCNINNVSVIQISSNLGLESSIDSFIYFVRLIVFRPSIGDILTGKIRSCSREGVYVTLSFFDDIFVPATALQHPSRFEEAEQAWVWEYPFESGETHDLYMDIGEPIKFRVSGETFVESSPIGPPTIDQNSSTKEVKTPYKIIAVINESGLGVLSWWDSNNLNESENEENDNNDESNAVEDEEGEGYEE